MTTTPQDTLTQQLTAITTAVSTLQSLVQANASAAPPAAASIEQQLTNILTAVSSIAATATGASAGVAPTTPVSASAAYTPLLLETYTQYPNTAAFLANVTKNIGGTGNPATVLYNDGANATLAAIDPTVQYNGHQTLKYTQPAGVPNTPELWVTFPNGETVTSMWIRTKLRFGPGWTDTGVTPNSANAYKLLGWGWATTDGRGSLEFTNTTQYVYCWVVTNTAGTQVGQTEVDGPHTTTEWSDGAWYDYILQYHQTSPTTVTASWWLAKDGQPPVLQQTITGTMTKGTVPAVNRVLLGLNFNQQRTPTQAQALWYGQWEVVNGTLYPDPYGLL